MINKVLSRITDDIDFGAAEPQAVTYLNAYNYTILRAVPSALNVFDKITLDGILLVIFVRLFYRKKLRRTSPDFSSFFKGLFEYLNEKGESVAFIGASQEEMKIFVNIMEDKYAGLNIDYYHSGYDLNEEKVAETLISRGINTLFVGMGSPKQEWFITNLRQRGYRANCYSCGAFISQTAERGETYYPSWINLLHLRWAFRIYKEPKLLRRYALDYPKGILLILKDRFFSKK